MRARKRHAQNLPDLAVTLNLPGIHNVQNALAAIAVGMEVGVPDAAIVKALAEFRGVGRRFQRYGDVAIPVANLHWWTITAITRRKWPRPSPLRAAHFRPAPGAGLSAASLHANAGLFRGFRKGSVLVDALLLAEVYPAGEAPIVAADGRALARAIRVAGKVEPVSSNRYRNCRRRFLRWDEPGDVVVTMGAGSIGACRQELAKSD